MGSESHELVSAQLEVRVDSGPMSESPPTSTNSIYDLTKSKGSDRSDDCADESCIHLA